MRHGWYLLYSNYLVAVADVDDGVAIPAHLAESLLIECLEFVELVFHPFYFAEADDVIAHTGYQLQLVRGIHVDLLYLRIPEVILLKEAGQLIKLLLGKGLVDVSCGNGQIDGFGQAVEQDAFTVDVARLSFVGNDFQNGCTAGDGDTDFGANTLETVATQHKGERSQAVFDGAAGYLAHWLADGVEVEATEKIKDFLLCLKLGCVLSLTCQLNAIANEVVGLGTECGKRYSNIGKK